VAGRRWQANVPFILFVTYHQLVMQVRCKTRLDRLVLEGPIEPKVWIAAITG